MLIFGCSSHVQCILLYCNLWFPTLGGIAPSQHVDGSAMYALSPARCTSSAPINNNLQSFHNSPLHHNSNVSQSSIDTASRISRGDFPMGMLPSVPFSVDVKDQPSNLPNADGFPSLAESDSGQPAPKKKRRRRKKADPATADAAAGVMPPPCGAMMPGASELELNQSMFISQFPGSNLSLGLFVVWLDLTLLMHLSLAWLYC